jgi:hypothetical protein
MCKLILLSILISVSLIHCAKFRKFWKIRKIEGEFTLTIYKLLFIASELQKCGFGDTECIKNQTNTAFKLFSKGKNFKKVSTIKA